MRRLVDGDAKFETAGETFNFETANVLLLEQGAPGLDILVQIFAGFGTRNCYKSVTVEAAEGLARRCPLDLVVVDPALHGEDGLAFVRWLRRSGGEPNRTIPVIAVSANGARSAVSAARDAGVSYYLLKPIVPAVLFSRVVRVAREARAFVVAQSYVGPDRRFKSEGPPLGCGPRRASDLRGPAAKAPAPNLSQGEIDMMLKPQRANL